jgi:homoserine dehydrogenase
MQASDKPFRVAVFGCGTVGGGVARIIGEIGPELARRAGRPVELARLVDLFPAKMAERHGLPRALFAGSAPELARAEADAAIAAVLADPTIDLVVETIGGSSEGMRELCARILAAGKHLVTANKALLAKHGDDLFARAAAAGRAIGYEAAVCGAIPLIRAVEEGFSGDAIEALSGIMNGTSNYILTKMRTEDLSFAAALAQAQAAGYAEADPSLDINGGDAGHKLAVLLRLAFGLTGAHGRLAVSGIEQVTPIDKRAADELGCVIKLICHAEKRGGAVYAAVTPMMVKRSNFLSGVDGATNAVRFVNRYAGEHLLVGKGAGSLETGSAVVADIVFIARRGHQLAGAGEGAAPELRDLAELPFAYTVIFDTADQPGITGLVTTAIGEQDINIDTVGHNLHGSGGAIFSVQVMPCPRTAIDKAVAEIERRRPGVLRSAPKVYPVLG